YVYERYLGDKNILVFMNGTSSDVEINLDRYKESIKGKSSGKDVISGRTVSFGQTLKLSPKEVLVLE
ncbi:MAG: cyclomaltodextrinase C-terminal domain-containing protein, partial [Petrimonas sp.]|nr:cyclomaltodextrinase C-terminal domain-containing protein [Petrimonas sp.]